MTPIKDLGYLCVYKTSGFIDLLEKDGFKVGLNGHIHVAVPLPNHPKSRDCMQPCTKDYLEKRDGPSIHLPVGYIGLRPLDPRGSLVSLVNMSLDSSPGQISFSKYQSKIQNIFQKVIG